MRIRPLFRKRLIATAAGCLLCLLHATAADDPTLTKEQIKQFLLTAKIVGVKQASKGITGTRRLTLSDGKVTHDASFQSINEYQTTKQMAAQLVISEKTVDSHIQHIYNKIGVSTRAGAALFAMEHQLLSDAD